VAKLEGEVRRADEERRKALLIVEELNGKVRSAELRVREYETTIAEYKASASTYHKSLDDLRYQYELEAKKSAQWESKFIALQKDLELANASHSTVMESYRREHGLEIHTLVEKMQAEYDARLLAELQTLREDFARRLEANNLEIARMYKLDFSGINFDTKRFVADAAAAKNEVSQYRLKVHELETLVAERDSTIAGLRRRIGELENLKLYIADSEGGWKGGLAALEAEVSEKLRQYRYLLDLKVQLDTELNAYHLLLSGEEYRLHIYTIVPVEDNTGRSFVSKGHSDVDVVIDEINMHGNYVHLTNKGNKEFHLDSWMIKATSGSEIRKFKFQTNQVLLPGKSMSIWSPNRGGTHNPPDSYVMKAVTWPSGNKIRVELLDQNERMKAWLSAYYEVDTDYKSGEHHEDYHKATLIS